MEEREITFLFSFYIFLRKLPEGEKLRGIYLAMFLIFAVVARKRRERGRWSFLGVCKELL